MIHNYLEIRIGAIVDLSQTTIGDLVARVPIIQGGMGIGVSLSGLASAVANQGGIGVIATAGMGVLALYSGT